MTAHHRSLALFAGTLAGFVLAVLGGWHSTETSKPEHFERFHELIAPLSMYYPPFSMLENLAMSKASHGRTVVIIGGNSVMNGRGQPEKDLWSRHLQELLGERYGVVNLAFPASYSSEGAALVAESLIRRKVPVIYVANTNVARIGTAYGGSFYGHFYREALYKNRLLPFPERDVARSKWEENLTPGERTRQKDLQSGARLDQLLRFQALWHDIGYKHVFTVWNYLTPQPTMWWKPRKIYQDNREPDPPPLELRYRNYNTEDVMKYARATTFEYATKGGNGEWELRPELVDDFKRQVSEVFTPELRKRMIMIISKVSPYYIERLSPDELRRDEFVYSAYLKIWEEQGIACSISGQDFGAEDYFSGIHLAPSGGRKLAAIVAGQISQLTAQRP